MAVNAPQPNPTLPPHRYHPGGYDALSFYAPQQGNNTCCNIKQLLFRVAPAVRALLLKEPF